MRWTNPILTGLAAALIGGVAHAVPAANLKENYQSIIERNPFGLKDPPPPQTNNAAPVKEKPKVDIFLTGITAVGYPKIPKQAYFYTREQGKKDPVYYTLTEGDSKDGIQIVNIDPQLRKVRINMDNSETVLSFETHGVPVAAAPAKGGVPGAAPLPVPGQPQPGMQPLPLPAPPTSAANRPMYDASGQPAYQSSAGAVPGMNTTYQNAAGSQMRQIPSRRIRGGVNQPNDVMMAPGMGGTQ